MKLSDVSRSNSLRRLLASCVIAIVVTFAATSVSAATPVYFDNHFYTTNPVQSVAVDMNGDGHPDIVSASGSDVNVLLNDGTGQFLNPGNVYATGGAYAAISAGDLNADGKPDVAVADVSSNTIHILYNNGDGSLRSGTNLEAGGYPSGVVLADVNGDGRLDIAISHTDQNYISIFINQGSGNFAGPFNTILSPTGVQSLTSISAGDINGDGKIDLAAVGCCGTNAHGGVNVLVRYINTTPKGGSTPTFTSNVVETGTADSITLVDIDKDGFADYLVPFSPKTNCTAPCNSSGVSWFFNNPDGSTSKGGYNFNSPGSFYTGAGSAIAADFNGDGFNDIAVSVDGTRAESGDQVRYFLATGRRSFSAAQPSENGQRVGLTQILSADVNGDHNSDLIAVQREFGTTNVKTAHIGDPGWGTGSSEFCAPPSPGVWHVCSPKVNQVFGSSGAASIFFDGVVTAPTGQSVLSTTAFIDGQIYDTSNNRGMIGMQNVIGGPHSIRFHALLSGGGSLDKTVNFFAGGTAPCAAPGSGGVAICSPAANATVSNPVNISALASAPSGQRITAMKLYVDSVAKYLSSTNSLNTSLSLPAGTHKLTVNAWTNTGIVEKASELITVR